MAKEFKISKTRLKELEEELFFMKTVREKEVAEQIKEARSFGDLSENSEYDEAKNEQAKLYGRIAEVENVLAHAVLINEDEAHSGRVALGCKVKILDLEFDEEETYCIVGSQEANPMSGFISDESPFGKAIMDKEEGETIEFTAPAGVIKYKIITIEKNK